MTDQIQARTALGALSDRVGSLAGWKSLTSHVSAARSMVIVAASAVALTVLAMGGAASADSGKLPAAPQDFSEWTAPTAEDIRDRAFAWLDDELAATSPDDEGQPASAAAGALDRDAVVDAAAELWGADVADLDSGQCLIRLVSTFALVDSRAADLVRLCSEPKQTLVVDSLPWLSDPQTDPFVAANSRLLFAKWLVQEALYDEGLAAITGLDVKDVVDPAALLFLQAVLHHQLLNKEDGLEAVEKLVAGEQFVPRRYLVIARLLEQDLQSLEDESLDHISRQMNDIRRRLQLGRAGERVRGMERQVVESLEKIIKKLEEQQKKKQSGSGSGNNIKSSAPAPDSQIMGGKGQGDVERRKLGGGRQWGDLPEREREKMMQQVKDDFPPHYRDLVEKFFRDQADQEK